MFDWDEANAGHIWDRHRISTEEAEEVLLADDRVSYSSRVERSERRFMVVGSTGTGRVLTVVYAWRASRIRVVSAREPSSRELRNYRASKRGKR